MKPKVRPTTSKVTEALFSILGEDVRDSRFLDLFAGSGAIGLEALESGASLVVFCEKLGMAASRIRSMVKEAGFAERAKVFKGDALSILKKLKQEFDIIFIDPPYDSGLGEKAVFLIAEKNLLAPGGRAVVEHHHKNSPAHPENMELFKQKSYGETRLSFLRIIREDSKP